MPDTSEIRWQQRFDNFQSAFDQLSRACEQEAYSPLELSGLIKIFELTFETAWKTLKDLLSYEGFDVNSPRSAIRQAFASGIIVDPKPWLEALESRNLLSHTYDQSTADEAEALIKGRFLPMLLEVRETLRKRKDVR
jgi:nucleotidyltransferase substrate binding protein (TIGR01987 family)